MQLSSPARSWFSCIAPAMVPTAAALLLLMTSVDQAQANAADSYKLGLQYRQQKKAADALSQFNLAIQQDPRFADAYIQRIEVYCGIGQAAKTLDDCNKVIALDPGSKKYPDVYLHRAEAYKQIEEPEKVVADCNKAFALGCANKEQLYHLRAYGNKGLGNLTEAIQDLTTILDKYSPRANTILVYRARAELYEAINKPDKAISDLYKALAINPKFDTCYEQLARVHEHLGQLQKAVDDLTAVIKINPADETSYVGRGRLKLKLGRYADAVADLSKSIELDPRLTSKAYDDRAEAYTKLGKVDLAAKDRATSAMMKR
jgi:tetratricopeptide (TPR) repeat protein